ncbi:MAG: hypothetical protein WA417_14080, partial [Stellaceae bacterium]
RLAAPHTLADVDLTAIAAALASEAPDADKPGKDQRKYAQLERNLAAATARIETLEQENRELAARLDQIASLAAACRQSQMQEVVDAGEKRSPQILPRTPIRGRPQPASSVRDAAPSFASSADGGMHPAARKLLAAAAQHAPGRFTWGQLATLAGLKPSGGHFNSGRKVLRDAGHIAETNDPGSGSGTGLVEVTPAGLAAAGEVPAAPSTPAERLDLWCARLPAPAPEMLRTLVAQSTRYMDAGELAAALGKKPTGGHWNSGIALLRNNGLIEVDAAAPAGGRRYRAAALLRE